MELKKKKARIEHICSQCGKVIEPGEFYYCEEKFLGGLHKPLVKLCIACVEANAKMDTI